MSGIINATNLEVANIKDSTGTNTAMTVDSSGRVTTPQRPAFFARGQSNVAAVQQINGLTINSNNRIAVFSSIDINVGNAFNNTTGKFTVPVAGLYQVMFNIGYKANNTNYTEVALYLTSNDSVDYGYIDVWSPNNAGGSASAYHSSSATVLVNATVGQEFAMTYDLQYTTAYSSGIKEYASFGGYLIG